LTPPEHTTPIQGKVVITGGKKESDIERGWRELWPIIKEFVE